MRNVTKLRTHLHITQTLGKQSKFYEMSLHVGLKIGAQLICPEELNWTHKDYWRNNTTLPGCYLKRDSPYRKPMPGHSRGPFLRTLTTTCGLHNFFKRRKYFKKFLRGRKRIRPGKFFHGEKADVTEKTLGHRNLVNFQRDQTTNLFIPVESRFDKKKCAKSHSKSRPGFFIRK